MIKTEYYDTRTDGVVLVKTYSTENKYIKQLETNFEYDISFAKVVIKFETTKQNNKKIT